MGYSHSLASHSFLHTLSNARTAEWGPALGCSALQELGAPSGYRMMHWSWQGGCRVTSPDQSVSTVKISDPLRCFSPLRFPPPRATTPGNSRVARGRVSSSPHPQWAARSRAPPRPRPETLEAAPATKGVDAGVGNIIITTPLPSRPQKPQQQNRQDTHHSGARLPKVSCCFVAVSAILPGQLRQRQQL